MANQEDEVEAARRGLGSFPRAIPEDSVEYYVYVLATDITDVQRRDKLREIQAAGTALVKQHLKDFIWEQDSFVLNLSKEDGTSYLKGQSSYGDSVEDEWIVVWLLVELSKKFEDAWFRVADADGEFLLIEAASALPKWLNPEIADHRVWINRGHLKTIPKASSKDSSTQYSGSITLHRALQFLREENGSLLSDPKIEREAFFRLNKYPTGISETLHHALINIPRKLAFVLHKNPTYISPAIEAFYLRDPVALKPLQASVPRDLIFPPKDLVNCRTKFTRIGFAKVRSQQFSNPPSWSSIDHNSAQNSKELFQGEIGMKLTCGFEMLLSDPQNRDKKVVREIQLILEDLEAGEEALPPDEEIRNWGNTEDDDSWLDIDYQDFEQELAGKAGTGSNKVNGFGNADAQEKLQKMVSRFEDLMAEDQDGFDIDEMDEDNDSEAAVPDSDHESHNSAEEDFNEMMREMLGMSRETLDELMGRIKSEMGAKEKGKQREVIDEESDSGEEEEIRKLSEAMEAELNASGALRLDRDQPEKKTIKSGVPMDNLDQEESSDEEYLDEDYNLAKNMLESFKSQAGAAGRAGNLMSMLGVNMPRDEEDHD